MQDSEPGKFHWRDALTRENLVATAAVGASAGLAIVGAMVLARQPDNYAHSGFLEGMFEILVIAAVLFWLGAYLAAAVPWALDDRDPDHSPALVAVGTSVGAAVGFTLLAPLARFAFVFVEFGHIAALVTAWGGAMLAGRVKVRKPSRPWLRWTRMAAIAVLGLGLAMAVMPRGTGFPGAQAPMPDRRAWAVKTFDTSYLKAEEYLKASKPVTDTLGQVEAIAPTEGINRTAYSPGELMGEFTLEVKGTKATGTAHLRFMHGSSSPDVKSYGFSGELKTPTTTVTLPELP